MKEHSILSVIKHNKNPNISCYVPSTVLKVLHIVSPLNSFNR